MRWVKNTYNWFERRLQLEAPVKEMVLHPVPKNTASWFYVFGSAAFTLLILQVVTGIFLAIVYVPSASQAWNSLNILNHQLPLGWFLRAMHSWGSNFMVAIVLIHMAQVFLFGSYKFPRELTWVIGVILLLLTLGMAFTGQVLRFDQDAYWGLGIGASIMGRVPLIGEGLVKFMLGGPIIAGATLTRFFALHVFIIPGLLLLLALIHVWMVLKLGINEWPMPGRVVRRDTYIAEYNKLAHEDGIPFVPGAFWKDVVFSACIVLAVAVCAFVFGPNGPTGQPDPTIIQTTPKPDFWFLWIFAVLSYLPPNLETPVLLIVPPIILAILIALPFYAGEGEKSWHRRPVAVIILVFVAVLWGIFTHLGTHTPWSPKMDAWSQDTVPVKYLQNLTPVQRQGAVIFQGMQCRNCHSLDDIGGRRGPMLDDVAMRLTEDQLIRQVVQGGGNMPAYGKNLSPPQVTALVKFLETLHPPNQRPARDASLSVENTVAPGSKSLGAARQGGSGETLEPPSKPLSNEDKK
jgi:ubiquinol-cytochrome c reductase cytochrome b subunit